MRVCCTGLMAMGLLVLVQSATAAGGGHDQTHGPTSEAWLLLAFTVTNFLIFLLLMRRFAAKPLQDFLTHRRQEIGDAIAEATKARAEAEALKREYEEKEKLLEQHKLAIIGEVRAIAEADGKRLREAARISAQRMLKDAGRTAVSDLERAKLELRAEAARLAAELARKRVTDAMDKGIRGRLLDEFLTGVGR